MKNTNWIAFVLIYLKSKMIPNFNITLIKDRVVYIILLRWYIWKIITNFEANMDHYQILQITFKIGFRGILSDYWSAINL